MLSYIFTFFAGAVASMGIVCALTMSSNHDDAAGYDIENKH